MLDKLEDLLLSLRYPDSRCVYKWPKNLTLFLFREMERIYQCLKNGRKAEFITSDLVPYLEKCGVKVDECGIGYVASL